jgi:hypothetical protein
VNSEMRLIGAPLELRVLRRIVAPLRKGDSL